MAWSPRKFKLLARSLRCYGRFPEKSKKFFGFPSRRDAIPGTVRWPGTRSAPAWADEISEAMSSSKLDRSRSGHPWLDRPGAGSSTVVAVPRESIAPFGPGLAAGEAVVRLDGVGDGSCRAVEGHSWRW